MNGNIQEEKHDQLDELRRGKLVPFKLSALRPAGRRMACIGAGSVVSPMSELGQTEKNSV
jgi:hypothetical protein